MRALLSVAALTLCAGIASAQTPDRPTATLSLEDALTIARRNNPAYLQSANAQRSADAQVRSAYGATIPSANASLGGRLQQGGVQIFQGTRFDVSDNISSFYSVGLSYQINSAILYGLRSAKANQAATSAEISGAAELLRANVTQAYVNVLQAQARAALQDTLVITARGQLDLAKARAEVGAATVLDVRRAEVALGQAEVRALTEQNNVELERLRLFQQLGVPMQQTPVLTTSFRVGRPTFSLDSLLQLAQQKNPQLEALRARERASGANLRVAQGQYLPSLSLSTGVGGQSFGYRNTDFLVNQAQQGAIAQRASCFAQDSVRRGAGLPSISAQCNAISFGDEQAARIRNTQGVNVFGFDQQPIGLSLSVSLPLFDGFQREQRVQEARVSQDNARYQLRARELATRTEVTQQYLNLVTAARTVELQELNAQRAREELEFATERYRVGAATFLDVITSRGTFEQAQADRVNAIYDYHRAFAALENAVGRPLR